ncbi:MAG: LLM class flavin-dependent oxidoreductase [Thermoleophilaceae bacterium]|jgi:coenzyme F420-dependent glucose-6-phosphate dehydrogenase|nr:LLM class flavin-dependent oxidoreductase [Thermoleophilaceae bacterium]
MAGTKYWFAASTEEFTPSEMVEHAKAAEGAGFDGLGASDHFAPWFPDGRGSQAWVWLGAVGQVTTKPIGTGVTPVIHHYHPGLIAQAFMSLEELYPGRVFLGTGSGEALNEVPLGLDWPEPGEMLERFEHGLEAIDRLWNGETVSMDGGWFRLKDAKLYTRARSRPRLYVSAFGPQAARIAGRFGEGLWTLGDPDAAPEIIEAYRAACSDNGKEEGEIILQAGFAWAESEQAAIEGARRWKPTQLPELYRDDIWDPDDMQRRADEQMTDVQFAKEGFLIGSDPDEHVERIREIDAIGGTVTCLQLIGSADPMGSIRVYGEQVLPALREG